MTSGRHLEARALDALQRAGDTGEHVVVAHPRLPAQTRDEPFGLGEVDLVLERRGHGGMSGAEQVDGRPPADRRARRAPCASRRCSHPTR